MSAVITRTARQTGNKVTVGTAIDMDLDPAEGACKWYCICEKHNTLCGHTTRKLALWFAAAPADWCEECREDLEWSFRTKGKGDS